MDIESSGVEEFHNGLDRRAEGPEIARAPSESKVGYNSFMFNVPSITVTRVFIGVGTYPAVNYIQIPLQRLYYGNILGTHVNFTS